MADNEQELVDVQAQDLPVEANSIDKIKPINIVDELKTSYLDYAMSVIMGRALPDARDGFKPVHRRVLYAMHIDGHTPDKPFVKSAEIVGKVMGLFHPHGDFAIYGTLVRLVQDFSLRYPLAQGQGNFGGRGGESAAAMRYTEARMSKMALEMLTDIDKETVDFIPNYSNKTVEPVVLPTRIPNLLVNGSSGIAVGMATNIPPHNLREVISGCLAYLDNEAITIDELMEYIPAPDFPTGGIILGRSGIREAYHTGRGKLYLRSVYEVTEKNGLSKINITEIPYQVSYDTVVEQINNLIKNNEILGISEVRNLSKNNINIELRIQKNFDPHVIMNQLFAKTSLQISVSLNMLALHNGKPQTLNLKQFISIFVDFRREVITRRCVCELRKARERVHILEALAVALANIDEIIALIRRSPRRKDAHDALMAHGWTYDVLAQMISAIGDQYPVELARPEHLEARYGINSTEKRYYFTNEQAKAILDMPLARLTGLEHQVISAEYTELFNEILDLLDILSRPERLNEVLRGELEDVRERHMTRANSYDARISQISNAVLTLEDEDLVNREDVVITFSRDSYIKYQALNEYRSQARGGRGRQATQIKQDDVIEQIVLAGTTDTLLCFTNFGRVYQIKVYRLPRASQNSRGRPINNYINLREGEKITNLIILDETAKEDVENKYLFLATEQGLVKRMQLAQFMKIRSAGLKCITLVTNELEPDNGEADDDENLARAAQAEDEAIAVADVPVEDLDTEDSDDVTELGSDRLCTVVVTQEDDVVYLVSRLGNVSAFNSNKVRVSGRNSRGVRGMRLLSAEDKVVGMFVPSDNAQVLTVTELGLGKRTAIDLITVRTNRGSKGVTIHKLMQKTGAGVVAASLIAPEDQVAIITDGGKLVRINADEIRETGRYSAGVRLIKLVEGELVASIQRVVNGQELEREDQRAQQAQEAHEREMRGLAHLEEVDEAETDDVENSESSDLFAEQDSDDFGEDFQEFDAE